MKILISILILLISSQCFALDNSEWTLIGATAFDFTTTRIGANNPRLHESNPLLGQQWYRQAAIMGGVTSLWIWNSQQLRKSGHAKLAKTLNYILAGTHAGAGAWNIRLIVKY